MRRIFLATMLLLISAPAFATTNGVSADHSAGIVLIGSGTANCNAGNTGGIRYNSTNPGIQYCDGTSWKAAGGMTLISTQTASNSASLQWTGLGSTYNTLFLNCNGIVAASAGGVDFDLQVGEGATPTWETASYRFGSSSINDGGGGDGGAGTFYYADSSGASNIPLIYWGNQNNAAGSSSSSKVWISNVSSSSLYKMVQFTSSWMFGVPGMRSAYGSGSYTGDTNAITAIRVLFSSGNITSGTCSLYGMN